MADDNLKGEVGLPKLEATTTPTAAVDETKKEVNEDETPKDYRKKSSSVADYGLCYDQNSRHRRRMEDAHFISDGFNNDPTSSFYAVYDGHGGKEAAIYCSQTLHEILATEINNAGGNEMIKDGTSAEKVLQLFHDTYLKTDEKMKQSSVPPHHGCTSVTCLVTGTVQDNNRYVYAANAGDARAVLCRGGKAIRITEDHKASNEGEAKRIQELGGFIIGGRVNGQIMITRSLGDHLMKEFIIGDPHLHYEKLTEDDTWLIIACDGLWDVVEDQPAVDFVLENASLSASEISKKLLVKALTDGSTDNLSIMVVKL